MAQPEPEAAEAVVVGEAAEAEAVEQRLAEPQAVPRAAARPALELSRAGRPLLPLGPEAAQRSAREGAPLLLEAQVQLQ
jgi:hypothetical protein